MTWISKLLAGITLLVPTFFLGGAAGAATVTGMSPGSNVGRSQNVQPVHGYHRRCRWSNRWGRHRHRGNRIRFCDRRPGFSFGFYYGPYLYWGPPRAYYRGYRRGRRVWGDRRRPGFVGRPRRPGFISGRDARPRARFRGDRVNRPRFRGNRQFRRNRGGQRPMRRRRSEAPATYVLTSFGGVTELIGTLPVKA